MNEEQLISEILHGEGKNGSSQYFLHENGTYMVISEFAYLIGVPTRIFKNEHEPHQTEWYEKLPKDRSARIIWNFCMLRTDFECHYKCIYQAMR